MNPRGQGVDDDLVNLGLALIAAVGVIAAILRLAGSAAAWLSGASQPRGGWESGFRVLSRPGDPAAAMSAEGLDAWVYWLVLALMVSGVVASALLLWRCIGTFRHTTSHDPRRLTGVATGRDVRTSASRKALLARGRTLRPSLNKPEPSDVGYLLGRSRGQGVWASVEDSILLLGPPRSGKGLHVVINAILDAPGAVITTATRPDNIAATLAARQERGPVAVFDPQRLAEGLPAGLRWSPVRGCEDPLTAMIRATGLASATGLSTGGVESGGFWEGKTRTALQALLHAAALDNRSPRELFGWTLSPSAAADAVAILSSSPKAAPGWADSLESMIHSDPALATRSGWASRSPSRASRTRACSPPCRRDPASTSTPSTSLPTTARSTCSPPAPEREPRGRWSRHSSKTSSRLPDTSPRRHPEPGSIRRC